MNTYVPSFRSNSYNAVYSMINQDVKSENLACFESSIFGAPLFNQDIFNEVLKHSQSDLVALSCVSKQFDKLTNDYAKTYRPAGCFGKTEWITFGGDPGDEPFLPLKMIQDFDSSNWMLTLIPETINDEKLTLSSIDRFVSDYKNGKEAFKSNYRGNLCYLGINDDTPKKFKAHWVILSKDV